MADEIPIIIIMEERMKRKTTEDGENEFELVENDRNPHREEEQEQEQEQSGRDHDYGTGNGQEMTAATPPAAEEEEEAVPEADLSQASFYRQSETLRRFKYKCGQFQRKNKLLKLTITDLHEENEKLKAMVNFSTKRKTGMPKVQALLIEEAMRANHCNSSSRIRYSAEWIIYSIILRTQSPTAYNFLKAADYLPLPCATTLNNYVKRIEVRFGFDKLMVDALGDRLKARPLNHRRGGLYLTEIYVGKADSAFDVRGLGDPSYSDPGDQTPDYGDHALLFVFSPYSDSWYQLVGAFCSKGKAPALTVRKLLIQCVRVLHEAGIVVESLNCDRLGVQVQLLADLGISGELGAEQCRFTNPSDPVRNIYIMNDIVGLFKKIRYDLSQATVFKFPAGNVHYCHYLSLMEHLQKRSGNIPNFEEMTNGVKKSSKKKTQILAQFFSKSTVEAMKYLRDKGAVEFEDCQETIAFTERIAEILDIINHNGEMFSQGMKMNSYGIKKIYEMLVWLDTWEMFVNTTHSEMCFLSQQTREHLRVTLHSIIELTNLLLIDAFPQVFASNFRLCAVEDHIKMACRDGRPTVVQFFCIHRLLLNSSFVHPESPVRVQPVKEKEKEKSPVQTKAIPAILRKNPPKKRPRPKQGNGENKNHSNNNKKNNGEAPVTEEREATQIVYNYIPITYGTTIDGVPIAFINGSMNETETEYHEIILETAPEEGC